MSLLLPALSASTQKLDEKYKKLFKNKKIETAKGQLMTLHKMDGKIFVEFPVKLLGRDMLLGATISSLSQPDVLVVGMKHDAPLHIRFARQDSAIVVKQVNNSVYKAEGLDENINKAIALNYQDPNLQSFRIMTYTPDSTAIVFDATSLLASPNSLVKVLPSFLKYMRVSMIPQNQLSHIVQLKSFDNNASVKNDFYYTVKSRHYEGRAKVGVTYSLLLLPKTPMTERIVDTRVGIFSSSKRSFDQERDCSRWVSLAHRWRIEPRDVPTFMAGGLSEPTKKITFYLDDTFPANWRSAIKSGVLRWNAAFQRLGFKNVVEILDFPKDDPSFDPDNLNYSCIRFVPNATQNAMGPSWVDPRSGEIINASVLVYNNLEKLLYTWRFLQTSAVDPKMQCERLPQDYFEEALSYAMAHEVGHTLGLMHNMGASHSFPTDSLRSPEFCAKYGTTPSIMDYARFNYVAQAGDNVQDLCPPFLGAYDYHAIEWNYRYFPKLEKQVAEQTKRLEKMVDERYKNPLYRYYPADWIGCDPRSATEDIGSDPLKSSDYGLKNLDFTLQHLGDWIRHDEDSRKKKELYSAVTSQYYRLFNHVMNVVGGIYLSDSKESASVARYSVVPKARQQEAMLWALNRIKSLSSAGNKTLEEQGFIASHPFDLLADALLRSLYERRAFVIIASSLDPQAYSLEDYFSDIYASSFEKMKSGEALTKVERLMQNAFLKRANLYLKEGSRVSPFVLQSLKQEAMHSCFDLALPELATKETLPQKQSPISFGNPVGTVTPNYALAYQNDESALYLLAYMNRLEKDLPRAIQMAQQETDKAHYEMLLFQVKKLLKQAK